MFRVFIIMLFSFSIFANNQNILKKISNKIINNNKQDKTSFVVFNLDNVLLNSTTRYELLFNNYLKKHNLRVIKKYFKEKNFANIKLSDVVSDVSNLNISKKQKEKFKKYLEENYNSSTALSADIAIGESIDFVNNLYKDGAFIIYITKRNLNNIALTVNKLKNLNFPIGKNKTTIIMNVNHNTIRTIISKWINMGEIIAVFDSNIKNIKLLIPYFSKDKLFFISNENFDSKSFTIIKSL